MWRPFQIIVISLWILTAPSSYIMCSHNYIPDKGFSLIINIYLFSEKFAWKLSLMSYRVAEWLSDIVTEWQTTWETKSLSLILTSKYLSFLSNSWWLLSAGLWTYCQSDISPDIYIGFQGNTSDFCQFLTHSYTMLFIWLTKSVPFIDIYMGQLGKFGLTEFKRG